MCIMSALRLLPEGEYECAHAHSADQGKADSNGGGVGGDCRSSSTQLIRHPEADVITLTVVDRTDML